MVIGYTTGVFDLFHIGHVNLLKNAKLMCDRLIVGVSIDPLVLYKNKNAVIPFEERIEVVRACRYVDLAVPQTSLNKIDAHQRYKFDLLFVGDDWYKSATWQKFDADLLNLDVKVIYLPYTSGTTSTLINKTLESLR